MEQKEQSTTIHAKIATSDLEKVDEAADLQKPFAISRSRMIAIIVREWVNRITKKK
jgi:hypothetical protein